jgi:hypothetical protein
LFCSLLRTANFYPRWSIFKFLPVPRVQIAAEPGDEVLPVLYPRFSALLKCHDIPTDFPPGFGDVRVSGLGGPELTGDVRI